MSSPQDKPQPTPAALPPGTILHSTYRIETKVGGGGMAVVYRAVDIRTDAVWAIKEMCPQPGAMTSLDEAKAQFEQEAKLLSRLDHPNLPKVVDYFEEKGRACLVMEFVDGRTLERCQALAGGRLPEEMVAAWAIQLCDALSYLHMLNPPIIFRDLKPGNIMLTQSGVIKLIDFGIARTYKSGKKRDTTAMGSENYAPPEQWGKGQTDARSDVYALGATMYHLLTGRPPAIAFLPDPLEPPGRLNPSLSSGIEQVVLRAMAKDPPDRYQTAAQFGDVLRRTWSDAQQPKSPPSQGTFCPKCKSPNRPQARFCGLCGASLSGLLPASLRVIVSGVVVRELDVCTTPFLIGRSDPSQSHPDLDLSPYDAKYISRHHAEIAQTGGEYVLTDCGSANGTFVNGQQLAAQTPWTLRNGDHIRIGGVNLVFRLDPGSSASGLH